MYRIEILESDGRQAFLLVLLFLAFLAAEGRLTGPLAFRAAGFRLARLDSSFQAVIPTHLTAMWPTAFSVIVAAMPDSHSIKSGNEIGFLPLMRSQRRSL